MLNFDTAGVVAVAARSSQICLVRVLVFGLHESGMTTDKVGLELRRDL